jgi:hypothetical protein
LSDFGTLLLHAALVIEEVGPLATEQLHEFTFLVMGGLLLWSDIGGLAAHTCAPPG